MCSWRNLKVSLSKLQFRRKYPEEQTHSKIWNFKVISKIGLAALGLGGGVGCFIACNPWATNIYGNVYINVLNDTEKSKIKDAQVNSTNGKVEPKVDKKQKIKAKQGATVSVLPRFPYFGSKGVACWNIFPNNETKGHRLNVAWDATKRRRLAVCLQESPGDDRCYTFEELTHIQGTMIKNIEEGNKNEVNATRGNISVVASTEMKSSSSESVEERSDMETDWLVNVVVRELDRNLKDVDMGMEKNSLVHAVLNRTQ